MLMRVRPTRRISNVARTFEPKRKLQSSQCDYELASLNGGVWESQQLLTLLTEIIGCQSGKIQYHLYILHI